MQKLSVKYIILPVCLALILAAGGPGGPAAADAFTLEDVSVAGTIDNQSGLQTAMIQHSGRDNTLRDLARLLNFDLELVAAMNGLEPDVRLKAGQTVVFPSEPAVTYEVRPGDTVSELAERFNTSAARIVSDNDLSSSSFLRVGQVLDIPGPLSTAVFAGRTSLHSRGEPQKGEQAAGDEPAADDSAAKPAGRTQDAEPSEDRGSEPSGEDRSSEPSGEDRSSEPSGEDRGAKPSGEDRGAKPGEGVQDIQPSDRPLDEEQNQPVNPEEVLADLAWPVSGVLTSPFGMRDDRMHEGLDIADAEGTAIRAALAGWVVWAGPRGTYGKAIILRHQGGVRTLYAHASRLLVNPGEWVEQGAKIAEVGSTGHSTGPHLHFEVLLKGAPLDPLQYLR